MTRKKYTSVLICVVLKVVILSSIQSGKGLKNEIEIEIVCWAKMLN